MTVKYNIKEVSGIIASEMSGYNPMTTVNETYTDIYFISPLNKITMAVTIEENDITISFNYDWHWHPDMYSQEVTDHIPLIADFLKKVLDNELKITYSSHPLMGYYVSDNENYDEYKEPDEIIFQDYWQNF